MIKVITSRFFVVLTENGGDKNDIFDQRRTEGGTEKMATLFELSVENITMRYFALKQVIPRVKTVKLI